MEVNESLLHVFISFVFMVYAYWSYFSKKRMHNDALKSDNADRVKEIGFDKITIKRHYIAMLVSPLMFALFLYIFLSISAAG